MGYWIIVGMIVCAFGMVIIALTADAASTPSRSDTDKETTPEPVGEAPERSRTPVGVRWTAFVPTGIARPWPVRVDAAMWGVCPTVVALSDPSIMGIRSAVSNFPESRSPHIVSMQVGLDDLLSGTPRDSFINDLSAVLDLLRLRNIVAVVGDIPDLSRLSVPGGETMSPDDLRRLTEDWNVAISHRARALDAVFVDLFDVPFAGDAEQVGIVSADPHSTWLDQHSVATTFRSAIESAIRIASLQAKDSR